MLVRSYEMGDPTLIKRIIALVRDTDDSDEWINLADRLPPKSTPEKTAAALLWVPTSFTCPFIVGHGTMENAINVPYTINDWTTPTGGIIFNEVVCWKPLLPPSNECINKHK